jgi:2-iminobutanoate/2-iminopropanoate deaminase
MRYFAQASGALAGVPYSPAVRDGDLIFIAGQIGLGDDGKLVEGGIASETEACLESMKRLLEEMGASMKDVVKTLVFLVDFSDFAGYNEVYRRHFSADFPARSTVGTPELALGARIEIEAVAVAS